MLWRRFLNKFFGIEYCVLVDFDGEENIRQIINSGGLKFANRMPFGVATVRLLDNGKTDGAIYVDSWRKLEF